MTLKQHSHFGLAHEIQAGDIVTHYDPETGTATTFEVYRLIPTKTNALVAFDTSAGALQALAGAMFEIFDFFDLADES